MKDKTLTRPTPKDVAALTPPPPARGFLYGNVPMPDLSARPENPCYGKKWVVPGPEWTAEEILRREG